MTVSTAILTHDKLCHFCIWGFDIDRVFQSFFIIPHDYLQPPLFSQGHGCITHSQDLLVQSSAVSMVRGP